MHAREVHTYEMHAHEVHVYEVHAPEIHTHEMHACEVHALRYTPMRCTFMRLVAVPALSCCAPAYFSRLGGLQIDKPCQSYARKFSDNDTWQCWKGSMTSSDKVHFLQLHILVAIEFGGTRMRGRVPVKEQQSRTNAIWTSWRPRGANLVYSHS
jgi:hypothetical protein